MAHQLDSITLPPDLLWVDEYAHTPVKQTVSTSVDGSLVIETGLQPYGRPITLQGGEDFGWITKLILEQLRVKQYTAGLAMVLTINGSGHNVIFQQPGGIDATPVIGYSNPDGADVYTVTLKFLEIPL